jgi:hypothetical protein
MPSKEICRMKRSLFLAFAAGLIASVALTAPAKAASTLVTTTAFFELSPPTATTIAIGFTYQDSLLGPLTSISDIHVVADGGLGVVDADFVTNGTNTIAVTFAPANHTDGTLGPPPTPGLRFTFLTDNAVGNVFLKQMAVLLTPGETAAQSVSVTSSAVPEPASLALLGIGMTGFLAFRRFFKKTAVA